MASIVEVHCDRCDFSIHGSDVVAFAIREDGSEVVLRHPSEDRDAQEFTGRSLEELRQADRVRVRRAYVCLSCGSKVFYGQHGKQDESVVTIADEDRSIVPLTNKRFTRGCPACGEDRLFSLNGSWDCSCCLVMLACHVLIRLAWRNMLEPFVWLWTFVAWFGLVFLVLMVTILTVRFKLHLRLLSPGCPRCKRGKLKRGFPGGIS